MIANRYLSFITGKIYNSKVLKLMWRPENLDCVEPLGLLALKIQLIPLEVFKRPVSNGRKLTGMSFLRGTTPILALRIGMKTLTVLIRKVRTT